MRLMDEILVNKLEKYNCKKEKILIKYKNILSELLKYNVEKLEHYNAYYIEYSNIFYITLFDSDYFKFEIKVELNFASNNAALFEVIVEKGIHVYTQSNGLISARNGTIVLDEYIKELKYERDRTNKQLDIIQDASIYNMHKIIEILNKCLRSILRLYKLYKKYILTISKEMSKNKYGDSVNYERTISTVDSFKPKSRWVEK